jgi:hypothetical protein
MVLLFESIVLKGTVSPDFLPAVFYIKKSPLGPWFTDYSCFAYGFEFATIFDSENQLLRSHWNCGSWLFCWSSPLICTFSQSWAFATFSPIRYLLLRYFNTSFRYPYSATFPKITIRYSLFAIATFVSSVLRTASILGLYLW